MHYHNHGKSLLFSLAALVALMLGPSVSTSQVLADAAPTQVTSSTAANKEPPKKQQDPANNKNVQPTVTKNSKAAPLDEKAKSQSNSAQTAGKKVEAVSPIKANDFSSLKKEIEDPNRPKEIVVPGGTYNFTDTITSSKDLTIKNAPNQKVIFDFGLKNTDDFSTGKTMLDVTSGKLTIAGQSNDSIVFDGLVPADNTDESAVTSTSDKGQFITVHKGAEVEVNHATFQNSYNEGMQSAPLYVDGGKLVFNDGIIQDNRRSSRESIGNSHLAPENDYQNGLSSSSGIGVRNAGQLIINGGQFTGNRSSYGTGGVVSDTTGSSVTINNGSFSNNHVALYGGAIYNGYKGNLTINNGSFDSNSAAYGGGAVFLDWGSNGVVNGGTYTNNDTEGGGGALGTFDRYKVGPDSGAGHVTNAGASDGYDAWKKAGNGIHLTINGGLFKDNNAGEVGGAIYISSDDTTINKATIEDNTAAWHGGGIYLSSQPYVLTLKNVYIEGNTAQSNGVFYTSNSDGRGLYADGGGVWYCPTGTSAVYVSNGVAFYNNKAGASGDDFTSLAERPDETAEFSSRILGGGKASWYEDGYSYSPFGRYSATDPVPFTGKTVGGEAISLKSIPTASALALAKSAATVILKGNVAGRGGAIGTNGTIIFGDKGQSFNIDIKKHWAPELTKKEKPVTVNLIAKYKGKNFVVDTAELNADNKWSHQFTDLPLQAGNLPLEYTIQEITKGYVVSYSANNNVMTSKLQPKSTISIDIFNKTKSITPVQPIEPTIPVTPITPVQPNKPNKPIEPNDLPIPNDQPIPNGLPIPNDHNDLPIPNGLPTPNKLPMPNKLPVPKKAAIPTLTPRHSGKTNKLPQTSSQSGFSVMLLGFAMLLSGFGLLILKDNKNA